jgi:CubicO group peptidase (beta-lactamase class C family)
MTPKSRAHTLKSILSSQKNKIIITMQHSKILITLLPLSLATLLWNPTQTFAQPILQPQISTRLDSFFRTLPANQPGIALTIEKHGDILYRNAAGLADLDTNTPIDSTTNFRMASLSKQFTAMAILLLEKDGRLSLKDPLGRWLPELPTNICTNVLIAHLLTHSSGILDYETLIPDTQTTQVLDADVLKLLSSHDSTYFRPGARFRYSNSGFCLLALIVERASHETFANYIKQKIFLPLGMDHSTIYEKGQPIFRRAMGFAKDSTGKTIPSDQSVTSATKGDGGVYTSLTDYRKWLIALQENRLIDLPAALQHLRFPIRNPPNTYYAAGWFINNQSPAILFHSGSTCGFATYIIRIPSEDWSVTYFSNLAENQKPFRQILRLLEAGGMPDLAATVGLQDLTR